MINFLISIWNNLTQNKRFRSIVSWISLTILFCLFWAANSAAHFPEQSYLYFKIYDHGIETRLEITVPDLNQALQLNLPTDMSVQGEDLEPHLEQIQDYIDKYLTISGKQQDYTLKYQGYDFFKTKFAQFVTFDYQIDNLEEIPHQLDVYYGVLLDLKPEHKNLVVIEHNWKTGTFNNESEVSLIFTSKSQPQTLDLSSGSLWRGFVSFFKLGFLNIAQDLDHILFLMALIFPAVLQREESGWQPIPNLRPALIYLLKMVVLLIIAHSITLAFATLQILVLPDRLVRSAIAAAIAIAAVNLIYPLSQKKFWFVIFGCGLFQGWGFALVLAKLNAVREQIILSLLGFNLGIEVGQIVIIAIMFPLMYLLRKQNFYAKILLKLTAISLIVIALYWFIERALAINIPGLTVIKQIFQSIL